MLMLPLSIFALRHYPNPIRFVLCCFYLHFSFCSGMKKNVVMRGSDSKDLSLFTGLSLILSLFFSSISLKMGGRNFVSGVFRLHRGFQAV